MAMMDGDKLDAMRDLIDPVAKVVQYSSAFGSWLSERAGDHEEAALLDKVNGLSYRLRSFLGAADLVDEVIYLMDIYNNAPAEQWQQHWKHIGGVVLESAFSTGTALCDVAAFLSDTVVRLIAIERSSGVFFKASRRIANKQRALYEWLSDVFWMLAMVVRSLRTLALLYRTLRLTATTHRMRQQLQHIHSSDSLDSDEVVCEFSDEFLGEMASIRRVRDEETLPTLLADRDDFSAVAVLQRAAASESLSMEALEERRSTQRNTRHDLNHSAIIFYTYCLLKRRAYMWQLARASLNAVTALACALRVPQEGGIAALGACFEPFL